MWPTKGSDPHFHLRPKGGTREDDVLVRIDKPDYVINSAHKNTLSTKERRDLVQELSRTVNDHTVWEILRLNWSLGHSQYAYNGPMPDYNKLPKKS